MTETITKKVEKIKIREQDSFASDNRYLAWLQLRYIANDSKMSKTELKNRMKVLVIEAIVSVTFANDKSYTFARIFNNEKLARRYLRHNGYRVSLATKTRSNGQTLFAHNLKWLGKQARIKNVSERRDYESHLWKVIDNAAKKEIVTESA